MLTTFNVALVVEEKDDETSEGVQPGLPDGDQFRAYVQDLLADHTKHEGQIGWRVTRVLPAR